MVTAMAEKEGIPGVAYDAPVDRATRSTLCSIRIPRGSVYGQFMTQKFKRRQCHGKDTDMQYNQVQRA